MTAEQRGLASFSGLALWLTPFPASSILSNLIETLATNYSTPRFIPHVTLLSGLATDSPLESVQNRILEGIELYRASTANPMQGIHLKFGDGLASHKDIIWQYLFIKIQLDDSLTALRRCLKMTCLPDQAAEAAGDDYFPHLSLMYGQDTPTTTAAAKIEELESSGVVIRNRMDGTCSVGDGSGRLASIIAMDIVLMRCEGRVEDWVEMNRVPL